MTREEAIKILTILKANYQNLYKDISKKEAEDIVALYQTMFENCDYKLVMIAVQELINTFSYPPTIADIKNKMYELSNADNSSSSELWDKLLKAIRNGYYGCETEFDRLPVEVKEFLRSPSQLRELSQLSSDVVNSVVKGQFLKQIEVIKQRRKMDALMLPGAKEIVAKLEIKNDFELSGGVKK